MCDYNDDAVSLLTVEGRFIRAKEKFDEYEDVQRSTSNVYEGETRGCVVKLWVLSSSVRWAKRVPCLPSQCPKFTILLGTDIVGTDTVNVVTTSTIIILASSRPILHKFAPSRYYQPINTCHLSATHDTTAPFP